MSYKRKFEMNKYQLVLLAKSLYDNVNEFVVDPLKFVSPMEIVKKIENEEFDLVQIQQIEKINQKKFEEDLNTEGLI